MPTSSTGNKSPGYEGQKIRSNVYSSVAIGPVLGPLHPLKPVYPYPDHNLPTTPPTTPPILPPSSPKTKTHLPNKTPPNNPPTPPEHPIQLMPSHHPIPHRSTLNLPQTPSVVLPLTRNPPLYQPHLVPYPVQRPARRLGPIPPPSPFPAPCPDSASPPMSRTAAIVAHLFSPLRARRPQLERVLRFPQTATGVSPHTTPSSGAIFSSEGGGAMETRGAIPLDGSEVRTLAKIDQGHYWSIPHSSRLHIFVDAKFGSNTDKASLGRVESGRRLDAPPFSTFPPRRRPGQQPTQVHPTPNPSTIPRLM